MAPAPRTHFEESDPTGGLVHIPARWLLTQEVIGGEVVGVPDLQREARWDLVLGLIPGEHGLFLRDYNFLLRHEVIEGEDEAPVEVALSGQGMVVHVRVLLVLLLSLEPSAEGTTRSRLG